jgi:hypothetical protein
LYSSAKLTDSRPQTICDRKNKNVIAAFFIYLSDSMFGMKVRVKTSSLKSRFLIFA